MRYYFWLLWFGLFFQMHGWAQSDEAFQVQASKAVYLGKTEPYVANARSQILPDNRKNKQARAHFPKLVDNFLGAHPMPTVKPNALPMGPDPLRQQALPGIENTAPSIELLVNQDGISFGQSGSVPPDAVGSVSGDRYVQMTNGGGGAVIYVFDKAGNVISNPMNTNFIWGQVNLSAGGDPILLWDQEAKRWVICVLGVTTGSFLFAVSATSDPLGAYFVYQFFSAELDLPDYPKIGIWQDAYYITTNEPSQSNIPVYVVDRPAALAGAVDLDYQILGIPKFTTNAPTFQVATAADWDGALAPPANSPQYILRLHDDAWGDGPDRIEIWEFKADFENPANSNVTGPIQLLTTPFDATLCASGNIFDCIDQGNGSLISALQHVIMFRVQYRNFSSHESLVFNFSVDVSGNDQAGIRWMELRKLPGEEWSIYQEGTYAPDEHHRFMASIAMDGAGNIAMGYSVMGAGLFPSIRMTGRRNDDPLGTMTYEEIEIVSGENWNTFDRWGDYTSMSVDPVDEQTFWYTGEYMGIGQWRTRIASFILSRDSIDLKAETILTPSSSALLSNAETVTARFTNTGLQPQSNFMVGCLIDDVLLDTEMVNATVEPGSSIDISFSQTADLSDIKAYEFKTFVDLTGDQNIFNDTFRTSITKLPRYDAAVTNLPGTMALICNEIGNVGITIKNEGVETLTKVLIHWAYDGGNEQSIPWLGNLENGASQTIPIDLNGLEEGFHTFSARTELPNDQVDENMTNDALEATFEVFLSDPKFIQLEIDLDDAPQEVSWQIQNEIGQVLYSGGPYEQNQANTQIIEQLCIRDSCYSLTMFDSGNDGLCCNSGAGAYRLLDEEQHLLAQGNNYGNRETTNFCLPFVCFLSANINVINEMAPGANNGLIFIAAENATGLTMYSINGGLDFSDNSFFEGLSGGIYEVVVIDEVNCRFEETILVGTCAVDFTVDVDGLSAVGANDGSILINPIAGVPPFSYSINGGANSQSDPFFPNLSAGNYLITVRDSINCSQILSVELDVATSVKSIYSKPQVIIHPNPTDGVFQLSVAGITDRWTFEVELIDELGQVIQRGTMVRFGDTFRGRLSLYQYPAGMYFVRLLHPELQQLYRVIRL